MRARLVRGQAEGAPDVDVDRLADYLGSVQYGMSLQAREGAGRAELLGVVDLVVAGSDALVRLPA